MSKEFAEKGNKVFLITSDANHLAQYPETEKVYNFEHIQGIDVCWIKTKKYKKTASLSRILSWLDFEIKLFRLKKNNLDSPNIVLVSSLSIFTVIYGFYLKKKYKVPLVFEVRDIWPLTMTEEGGFSKWHPLVKIIGWIEKFGYKHADLIVGTMPKLDKHVEEVLGYKRPYFCSPLGFDKKSYDYDRLNDYENMYFAQLPKKKTIIGYAGSMGVTNNLEPLIKTIKLLKNNGDMFFALVGYGDLKEQFEKELKGCDNVIFVGRLPQEQVKFFLAKCDLVYLSTIPSKIWSYGQSMNKVVEYMLAAKPILASYSGYQSMINEANCGYFIKTDDPERLKQEILKFCELTEGEKSKMGERGRKWILEHRSYDKLASEYLEQLERLVQKKKLG
ncbi:glycosyltransferase family 4 protein [Fastidiosibacter lacustris]|uniref:glycosyltransferase family 4 protein n=1 Tax=Fastidiosibacter lacustris TaxID=2056695 RepID=UPI0013008216|nr:glycosyltransferase family 4 protein [Fastidiosibacter lacustris]